MISSFTNSFIIGFFLKDNPYLDFDESDATKPPVDSDYLEPIVKRTLARDPHSAKDGAFTS